MKHPSFIYIYIHTRKWDDGRNIVLGGNLDQTVSRDKYNSNIWTVIMIWEAKGNGEGKRGVTEGVTGIGEIKGW